MKPFTYLLVLFFTIFVCFIFSFHKRIRFDRNFSAFLKAALIVAAPFIAWDVYFTIAGVWWFDESYTIGLPIAGLPIEEWLFFLCIPFSCTFTFFCLHKFFDLTWADAFNNMIVFASTVVCVLIALLHYDKAYTCVTAVVTAATLIYYHFFAKIQWIGSASFIFFVLMLGFLPVNGVLTGTGIPSPIVNYNPEEFLGIRILTIPIEDAVYGYSQFLWVVFFFKKFQPSTTLSLAS